MTHAVVKREEWLAARMALLKEEKRVTRDLDQLAKARQALPWVEVTKPYTLDTEDGAKSLLELFGNHRQLIVYHFMYGPDWPVPCDGCSAWAAAFNGTIDQIEMHDATLIAVSSAGIEKLKKTKAERGWSFCWASSLNSDFNRDFHMAAEPGKSSTTIGDEIIGYDRGESGGINVFVKGGQNKSNNSEQIFHTYSAFNRGIQQMNGAFGYVDLLPYGGN